MGFITTTLGSNITTSCDVVIYRIYTLDIPVTKALHGSGRGKSGGSNLNYKWKCVMYTNMNIDVYITNVIKYHCISIFLCKQGDEGGGKEGGAVSDGIIFLQL